MPRLPGTLLPSASNIRRRSWQGTSISTAGSWVRRSGSSATRTTARLAVEGHRRRALRADLARPGVGYGVLPLHGPEPGGGAARPRARRRSRCRGLRDLDRGGVMTAEHHDVIVVGARNAGAATAMLLARAGHDVVLLDRSKPTTDTNSTHALSRGGVVQLAKWGLLDKVVASGAPRIRTVSFHLPGETIRHEVRDRAGVDFLLAPRRYVLDDLVAREAVAAGARLDTGARVLGVTRDANGPGDRRDRARPPRRRTPDDRAAGHRSRRGPLQGGVVRRRRDRRGARAQRLRASTPTCPASSGTASSCTSATGPSAASSRPTTTRPPSS